eukprot:13974975-Ditylum_brightwellii.AAC.1
MFQELGGRLKYTSCGVPGRKGLFSPIQQAMLGNPPFVTIDSFSIKLSKTGVPLSANWPHTPHTLTNLFQIHSIMWAISMHATLVWAECRHPVPPTYSMWPGRWPSPKTSRMPLS